MNLEKMKSMVQNNNGISYNEKLELLKNQLLKCMYSNNMHDYNIIAKLIGEHMKSRFK